MKIKKISAISFFVILFSCTSTPDKNPQNWTSDQLNQWFDAGKWLQGWNVLPDESINRKEFAIQYYKNKERWDKAFSFLNSSNIDTINPGTTELMGNDLFASVSEYTTKNPEDARFEVHRSYADIQYVLKGKEYINIMKFDNTVKSGPYNQEKDIAFIQAEGGALRLANPERFFIFFPDDAHSPGIKIDTNSFVKKIVVKVRIN